MYSKYAADLGEIGVEPPRTVNDNGIGNYVYETLGTSNNSFKARATAVTDFDGDGTFNVWEIDETGTPKQTVKD